MVKKLKEECLKPYENYSLHPTFCLTRSSFDKYTLIFFLTTYKQGFSKSKIYISRTKVVCRTTTPRNFGTLKTMPQHHQASVAGDCQVSKI